jgi:hypothetical protein
MGGNVAVRVTLMVEVAWARGGTMAVKDPSEGMAGSRGLSGTHAPKNSNARRIVVERRSLFIYV